MMIIELEVLTGTEVRDHHIQPAVKRIVFVPAKQQIKRKQKRTRTKVSPESTYVDKNGRYSLTDPHQRRPMGMWSTCNQSYKGERECQISECRFLWRKFVFDRNILQFEYPWVKRSPRSLQSVGTENGPLTWHFIFVMQSN